jgi:uncharacterized membrane protein
MEFTRLFRHSFTNCWTIRGYFRIDALQRIEGAIRHSESLHSGEICFAYERALSPLEILRGRSSRERALQVFSDLRIWDTERNNGVLMYLLLADRHLEIVADRGLDRVIPAEEWSRISLEISRHFAGNNFERGVIAGIEAISTHLIRHFPADDEDLNELPNRPVMV